MSSDANYFLKKTLGEDFFESLQKFDLWKPGTRTVLDHEEIKTALMIVPRTIMALLVRELTPMVIGETKEIILPIPGQHIISNPGEAAPSIPVDTLLRITKHERDVYSGDLEQENKKVVDFKYRSIPGVGLVIMSAFELYDTSKLMEPQKEVSDGIHDKIQQIIDERLTLHDLIGKVVDKKIAERDAVQQLILAKLTDNLELNKKKAQISELRELNEKSTPQEDSYFRGMTNGLEVAKAVITEKEPNFVNTSKKSLPLKEFLDKRKNRLKKKEFEISMYKGETINCPDCGNALISGEIFTGCICLGDDMDRKIYIKKTEDSVKVRFGNGWDQENIEMLLEVLRKKHGQ